MTRSIIYRCRDHPRHFPLQSVSDKRGLSLAEHQSLVAEWKARLGKWWGGATFIDYRTETET